MTTATHEPCWELWRKAWRASVPHLSTEGLKALERAIVTNDPRLVSGKTVEPPPILAFADFPPEAACLLGFCGWQGDCLETVGEVEAFFALICNRIDADMGEPGAVRYLLNPWDEEPDEMRPKLLLEVRRALSLRDAEAA